MFDTFDDNAALVEWVEKNVFKTQENDRKTYARLAAMASKDLGVEVTDEFIAEALSEVCRDKNYNLAAYRFK